MIQMSGRLRVLQLMLYAAGRNKCTKLFISILCHKIALNCVV